MLAIVRAVERFHVYVYELTFTIVTDCNALVYAVNKANLNPRIARWILTLQNYSSKVVHRPGKRMVHVDALNRCAGYVNTLPLERELEMRQFIDPKLREISRELEFGDNYNNKFDLVDGLVYRRDGEKLRFAVPDPMVDSLLRVYHDDMGHGGIEKTVQGISQTYWFPSLRKRVINHIENILPVSWQTTR